MTPHLGPVAFAVATLTVISTSRSQSFQFQAPQSRTPESLCTTSESVRGGMTAGDVTGDGLRDLVCSTGVTLLTMVQQPGGTFVAEGPVPSTGTRQPLLKDLDADGDLDLVVGPLSPQSPTPSATYLRGPLGWSRLTMPAEANIQLQGLDVGDLDNDGDLDILVASSTNVQQALIVLRNQGGTFVADTTAFQQSLPVGIWPRLVDFDRDGDLDVVGSYRNGGLVWLRQQNGTFVNVTAAMPSVRGPMQRHYLGDITGDGIPDILLQLANGDLDVLRGPNLQLQQAIGNVQDAVDILLPDLDGDGDRDVMAMRGALGLDVLFAQNGALTRDDGIAESIVTATTGDFDGNGKDEAIVVLSSWPNTVLAVANGSRRSLDAALEIGLQPGDPNRPVTTLVGDFDGDGFSDLLVPSRSVTPQPAQLLRGRGDGTHTLREVPSIIGAQGTRVRDIDNDGDLDLLATVGVGMLVYRNPGNGMFDVTQESNDIVQSFAEGDVDGDGDVDIVLRGLNDLRLLRNQGASFLASVQITAGATMDVTLADLDNDQDLDLVALPAFGTVQVFENDGTGSFQLAPSFHIAAASPPTEVLAGDYDRDGRCDLVVGNLSADMELLRNVGNRSFVGTAIPNTASHLPAHLADVDDDGHIDLIARGLASAQELRLLSGNGTGGFSDRTTGRVEPAALFGDGRRVEDVVDVDDDGDLDFTVVVGNVLVNRLRDLTVSAAPHVGAITPIELASGPGFSATGVAFVAYASARTARPVTVPGFSGFLHLDPASTVVAAAAPISSIGVTNAFLAVPPTPALAGLEFWLQAAIATQNTLPGFTNARRERILP